MTRGPRQSDGHYHPEYWAREDQHRFEDRMAAEIHGIRTALEKLTGRVLMIFGGVALLAFVIPLLVPSLRDWLSNVQVIP